MLKLFSRTLVATRLPQQLLLDRKLCLLKLHLSRDDDDGNFVSIERVVHGTSDVLGKRLCSEDFLTGIERLLKGIPIPKPLILNCATSFLIFSDASTFACLAEPDTEGALGRATFTICVGQHSLALHLQNTVPLAFPLLLICLKSCSFLFPIDI